MYIRLNRVHRALPLVLGMVTLASVGVLIAWDAFPRLFPANAHDVLAAFPLAMIAVAYLVYQSAHRPAQGGGSSKTILIVALIGGAVAAGAAVALKGKSSTTTPPSNTGAVISPGSPSFGPPK